MSISRKKVSVFLAVSFLGFAVLIYISVDVSFYVTGGRVDRKAYHGSHEVYGVFVAKSDLRMTATPYSEAGRYYFGPRRLQIGDEIRFTTVLVENKATGSLVAFEFIKILKRLPNPRIYLAGVHLLVLLFLFL
jgi:hypothetical protein